METLTCSCSKCHAVIGNFENLWDKIGKTYYSPICENSQGLGGLAVVGDIRAAPKAGAIENSFLQDVACQVCGEKLGLRCDTAPDGHVLIKDQLILRVAGMTIVSDATGRRASLRVRRKYSLIPQQPGAADAREIRDRSTSLIGAHNEIGNGVHPSQKTARSLSHDHDAIPSLLRFAEWARDAIDGQRKDIDRVCSTVSRMEEDMISFRDYISDLCKELTAAPGGKPWETMKNDFTFLKDDVEQLRMDMEAMPNSTSLGNEDSVGLSSEELEALTNSIMKINQKVTEVENLKLELQLMKGRMKRFEDSSRDFRSSVDSPAVESTPARQASRISMVLPLSRRVSGDSTGENAAPALSTPQFPRKRKSDEFGDSSGSLKRSLSVPASKRRVVSTELPPSTRRPSTTRKPSGLSKVQLIDDTPSPVNASKFIDGNNSENDSHLLRRDEREYESAPDTRPARRRTSPTRGNIDREFNSHDGPFKPSAEASRAQPTTPPRLTARPSTASSASSAPLTPRSRRRAYSEGLRNADGIRLTKNGTPDRRSGNYKYLKQYYDRVKAQRELEERRREQGELTGEGEANETDGEVLPSIEKDGMRPDKEGAATPAVEREEAKRTALEARDRLVRETLEREMEG